jgi:hypothetical protein
LTREERLRKRQTQDRVIKVDLPSNEPSVRNKYNKAKMTNSENNVMQKSNEPKNNLRYKPIVQLQAPLDWNLTDTDSAQTPMDKRISDKYSIFNYESQNKNTSEKEEQEIKFTPARNYLNSSQQKPRFSYGISNIMRNNNFRERNDSDAQTYNDAIDSDINSQHNFNQPYASATNLHNASETRKVKGNFLMERL